jgi:hypothetical protein
LWQERYKLLRSTASVFVALLVAWLINKAGPTLYIILAYILVVVVAAAAAAAAAAVVGP